MSDGSGELLDRLQAHEVPRWYHDAKLGIFIHWSVSSVPGFAPRGAGIDAIFAGESQQTESPYAEWYWNSLKLDGSEVQRHHREHYGEQPYEDFAPAYRAGLDSWQPRAWADAFAEAGAGYVVLVTKHHDGFCLWPSEVPHPDPHWQGWNTGRDVVGELAEATRAAGMRFGTYYSGGLDWSFEPRPVRGLVDVFTSMPGGAYPDYAAAQVRELVARYAPDVLWNDISWPASLDALLPVIEDYYSSVPNGLINDRWMTRPSWLPILRLPPVLWLAERLLARTLRKGAPIAPPTPAVYDVRTPEYTSFPDIQAQKWECVRGIDKSFGFNRASRPEDFLSHEELLHSLVDIVSKNGNLLLNVGPRGEDAGIPDVQLERLRWLGALMRECGQALHGTRPWQRAEGTTREGLSLRFTQKDDALYALVLGAPRDAITLEDLAVPDDATIRELGAGLVPWEREGGGIRVKLPDRVRLPVCALEIANAAAPER